MRYVLLALTIPGLVACAQAENSGSDAPVFSDTDLGSSSTPVAGNDAAPARTGPVNPGSPASNPCNAQASWIGLGDNPSMRETIAAEAGHDSIRFITPDTMVTEDFSLERLNIRIDESGTITGADCG